MLDQLDKIPWREFRDSYGTAERVPELIFELTTRNAKRQAKALEQLGDRICHQASCNRATAPAVPFLVELVRLPQTRNRHRIISLLQTIAIGLDFDQLYYQTRIVDWLAEMKQQAAERTESEKLDWGPAIGLASYSAVSRGVDVFLECLDDGSREVRINASYLLAWFPGHCQRTLPKLHARLRSVEHPDELAMAILSAGLLEFQSSTTNPIRSLVRIFLDDRREEVRFAAALYLYWHDLDDQAMTVIRELSQRDDYDSYVGSKSLGFAGYSWNQYAARLVHLKEGTP